ncbi:MAG TPA: alpha/beta fold hydrolase [Candidatus Anoxymicrobiaceae bacterium]
MGHVRRRDRVVAAILALALVAPLAIAGCGGGGNVFVNSYVVKEAGKEVGSQKVTVKENSSGVFYSSTESMPFTVFGTTFTRKVAVAKDLKTITSYESDQSVPGATYSTFIQPSADKTGLLFLDNRLQMYEWVPLLTTEKRLLPLEPGSVCTLQVLLERFTHAQVTGANATVVIPSRSPVPRTILIQKTSAFFLRITSPGIPDIEVTFDKNSFVTKMRTGDITIEKASPGAMTSTAFQPVTKGTTFTEVSVPTTEKLSNGQKLTLAGSMYFPAKAGKPYKAVILTGEEGPQDRTGGGFLSQIADALAGQGFVVLTCDRRGIPKSQGDYATLTPQTQLADIDSQVDFLVGRGDIDTNKIALVGYGEGGLLSASAAATNPYVKRLALMATPSVRMFPDFARVQVADAQKTGLLNDAEAAFQLWLVDALVATVNGNPGSTLQLSGHKVFLDWMRSWMAAANPNFAAIKVPVQVMQGTADYVVPASMAAQIMQGLQQRPGGQQQLAQFDGLGHSFGKELNQAASKPKRQHPLVDPKVLDSLTTWMKGM